MGTQVAIKVSGQLCYVQLESFDLDGDGKAERVLSLQAEAGGPAKRLGLETAEAQDLAAEHEEIAQLVQEADDAE
jgi:hypothetical protein